MASWQQVLAVDAKFNICRGLSHPGYRTLYLRRRSQLLREAQRSEGPTSRDSSYVALRLALLQKRYNVTVDQLSQKSRSTSIRSTSRLTNEGESPQNTNWRSNIMSASYKSYPQGHADISVVPTHKAEASRAIVGGTSIGENYAFSGVHHIFDQHKDSVTMVKFGHNDGGLLGCSSMDGTLSICQVDDGEPRVTHTLTQHSAGLTGFDWSCSNDLLVSGGLDGQICLFSAETGQCLRAVMLQSGGRVLACVFHPLNANWVLVGTSMGYVQVTNISAGLYPAGGTSKVADAVTALAFDSPGRLLWAGDAKGTVVSFIFCLKSGKLRKGRRTLVREGTAITSLNSRTWASREARNPMLLANCCCNTLFLFSIIDEYGGLEIKKKFSVPQLSHPIHSTFSPMMSFRQGACVVTGSEDCNVWFLDVERDQHAVINKLPGHASPVLSVSFNYNESLLATSDSSGLVIVWKRQREHK